MASPRLFHSTLSLPMAIATPAAAPELPPVLADTLCPSDVPLALLPVRLETRFFTLPDGTTELRIRVYPDKIQLDAHETSLTASEREWGVHYWTQIWRSGGFTQAQERAWSQLAERFGPPRAGWIARVLRPLNLDASPGSPLPVDAPLDGVIAFPDAEMADAGDDAAWRRAPLARLLPDRWIAIVSSGGRPVQAVAGGAIAGDLAVGPDPKAPPVDLPGDQAAVDAGMKWMIDFAEAEAKGMALRMPIAAATLTAGIDSLFVLGVGAGAEPADVSAAVGRLLDAHHYTDGLAFVRTGTPSNNTAEERSGYGNDDPGHLRSFGLDAGVTIDAPAGDANASRLAGALGLPAADAGLVLGTVDRGRESHDRDQRTMNTALWQATWGYYLSNLIGFDNTPVTPEMIAWARTHFVTHVRSAGPLPALRCGRQPYGVLPVTSLDLWRVKPEDEAAAVNDRWLRQFLQRLRDNIWRIRLTEVARLGRRTTPPDPDADLADVMRTDAVSSSYSARTVLGRHYFQHLRAFLAEDLVASGFIAAQDALGAGIMQRLSLDFRARLSRGTYADLAFRVTAPLIQAGDVSQWQRLEPNYIAALLAEPRLDGLMAAARAPGTSVLHALLRHALLREYADATAAIAAVREGASLPALLMDDELIDLVAGAPPTETWRRQLDLVVPPITGERNIREHLESLTAFDSAPVAALGETRASLAHLQALDSETLQYLMQGTLDLASHRLDAWVTSLASKRLADMRATRPAGLRVGGYGWVENLRRGPDQIGPAPLPVPAGEEGPLHRQPNESGFIHAPSVAHAATAALLRNAHLGSSGVPQANGPFAIDLTSRRVRDAKWLLDGVRQGQPLAALLGYRFERRLHAMQRDQFIQPCRQLAPLSAGRLVPSDAPLEAIAANNVVDGLLLHERWIGERAVVIAALTEAGASAPDLTALTRELDGLSDVIDGVSDALTAETAFQMVRGNIARTSATLNAIATGDAAAPELDVADTPRTGIAVTHRVLLLCEARGSSGNSVRAAAEPVLNLWASRLMGDPRNVRCTVERLDPVTGEPVERQTFPFSELGLAQVDVVYGIEDRVRAGELSEIEQRVLYQAKRRTGGFAESARLRLSHERPADLPARQMTLLEMLEHARAIRRMLSGVRSADPDDLLPPDRTATGALDIAQFEARVVRAENAFRAAHRTLETLVQQGTGAAADALRSALLLLANYGVPMAVPVVATGDEPGARAALAMQGTALLKESKARVDRTAALRAAAAAADPKARRDQLLERLRVVFGAAFVAMPQFTCGNGDEVKTALAGSAQLHGGDPLAAHTWFTRAARVRPAVARFGAPIRTAEVMNAGERLNLKVAQLPFDADDRWVALPPENGKAVPAGKVSLVVQTSGAVDPTRPLAGLVIDEWVEVVPSPTETTAITFQFNPPDACAPQSVLLAVPPVPDEPWTVGLLHRVLTETLDLAKLRAVDSEALGELAQYLPALYLAFNANDDVVSTDFTPMTKR